MLAYDTKRDVTADRHCVLRLEPFLVAAEPQALTGWHKANDEETFRGSAMRLQLSADLLAPALEALRQTNLAPASRFSSGGPGRL